MSAKRVWRKHRSDRLITILTFVLMALGLIVIYAIGPMRANALGVENENTFVIHQIISVAVSVVAFVVAFRLPYTKVRKYAKILLVVGLVACALLAVLALVGSGLAKCELGACRWYNLGATVSLQPAEILKLGLVMYLAQMVAQKRREGKLESWSEFWLPYAVVCGLSLFFVVIVQKDLGTGVSLIAIMMAILWMSGVSLKKFAIACGVILLAGVVAIVSSPHRMERLTTYGGEGDDAASYHLDNAMMAIGSGGLTGVGIGNSVQATGYLPESINDSVFAVMGETFGFVGLVIIVGCFTILLMRLLGTANGLPTEPALVVVGVFAWVGSQVIVNIAAMTGIVPLTGITLPLLSYGGTSMIFTAAALGVCSQLSCYTGRKVEEQNENISSRWGVGGTHHPSRRRSA